VASVHNIAGSNWLFVVVILVGALIGFAVTDVLPPLRLSTSPDLLQAGAEFEPSADVSIGGVPSIIDGDTLEIHGTRIRLYGIDAPESAQTCRIESEDVRCGQQASFALADLIDRSVIGCAERDTDRYGRMVAVCHLGILDLNAWMVEQGWAIAYRHYSEDYVAQEQAAMEARRGIWAGAFVRPWEWRRGERDAWISAGSVSPQAVESDVSRSKQMALPQPESSSTEAPAAETPEAKSPSVAIPAAEPKTAAPCNIKGNISTRTGERIYHMPGDKYYSRTRISLSKGERWFCTEEEAREAGWRRSKI
jgi:endonuclease YncB( thermonuclease family)